MDGLGLWSQATLAPGSTILTHVRWTLLSVKELAGSPRFRIPSCLTTALWQIEFVCFELVRKNKTWCFWKANRYSVGKQGMKWFGWRENTAPHLHYWEFNTVLWFQCWFHTVIDSKASPIPALQSELWKYMETTKVNLIENSLIILQVCVIIQTHLK